MGRAVTLTKEKLGFVNFTCDVVNSVLRALLKPLKETSANGEP